MYKQLYIYISFVLIVKCLLAMNLPIKNPALFAFQKTTSASFSGLLHHLKSFSQSVVTHCYFEFHKQHRNIPEKPASFPSKRSLTESSGWKVPSSGGSKDQPVSQHNPKDVGPMMVKQVMMFFVCIPLSPENCKTIQNMGVSKNRSTPKWMVYNGKPY